MPYNVSGLNTVRLLTEKYIEMAKNKRKQVQDMLFEVYDKGVQNEECNLGFYYEQIMQALGLAHVVKSVCDCGNPISSKYAPCCSMKCWSDKFE